MFQAGQVTVGVFGVARFGAPFDDDLDGLAFVLVEPCRRSPRRWRRRRRRGAAGCATRLAATSSSATATSQMAPAIIVYS